MVPKNLKYISNNTESLLYLFFFLEQTLGDSEGQTGKPGMLQFMGSQRIIHNLASQQLRK